ncbi:DNA cytosine methyltransferase [Streptomyces sp. CA-253872]|uniref:DNA cytosine methyltransferase n=1 Tax=Streptomyces sp. CA-253872 TaxID=3240067 RepID=UPI003D89B90C
MPEPIPIRQGASASSTAPRVLALCAGYGGLELALSRALGARAVAFAENDPYAARVFAAHHPGVPNLGDITRADWARVRDQYAPDVVAAGFPCRNISNAGRRDGIGGRWSKVWKNVAEAVGSVRPRYVFLENVAAIRSPGRGLDVVAGDLAALGYDARWTCLRAGDPETGAPHPRDRWFCLAHRPDADPDRLGRHWRPRHQPRPQGRPEPAHRRHPLPTPTPAPTVDDRELTLFPSPVASDSSRGSLTYTRGTPALLGAVTLLPTPRVAAERTSRGAMKRSRSAPSLEQAVEISQGLMPRELNDWHEAPPSWHPGTTDQQWGKYAPAIHRWENILGRPAPCPTEPGTRGNRRLSPSFVEWMMGLPAGWVTDIPDVPRTEQLRILGNGVVPQQAHHAYGWLLGTTTAQPTAVEEVAA